MATETTANDAMMTPRTRQGIVCALTLIAIGSLLLYGGLAYFVGNAPETLLTLVGGATGAIGGMAIPRAD